MCFCVYVCMCVCLSVDVCLFECVCVFVWVCVRVCWGPGSGVCIWVVILFPKRCCSYRFTIIKQILPLHKIWLWGLSVSWWTLNHGRFRLKVWNPQKMHFNQPFLWWGKHYVKASERIMEWHTVHVSIYNHNPITFYFILNVFSCCVCLYWPMYVSVPTHRAHCLHPFLMLCSFNWLSILKLVAILPSVSCTILEK